MSNRLKDNLFTISIITNKNIYMRFKNNYSDCE